MIDGMTIDEGEKLKFPLSSHKLFTKIHTTI